MKEVKDVPIVTDCEQSIIKAIQLQTNLHLLGCHRHLRNDIKRWVEEHGGGGVKVKRGYVSDVQDMIMAERYIRYTQLYNEFQPNWSDDFTKYF